MITFGRVVLFSFCLWFSLVPYAQTFIVLQQFQPASHERWIAVPWLLFSSIAPAVVVGAATCLPLARVFGQSAPWIALCLSAPFVALRFHLIRHDAKALEVAVACVSVVSYVLFVVGAAVLARRFLNARRTQGDSAVRRVRAVALSRR
jgi:hypothetical protein